MSDDSGSVMSWFESNFEHKPIYFSGRVWEIHEWLLPLAFLVSVFSVPFGILFFLILFFACYLAIGYFHKHWDGPIYGLKENESLPGGESSNSVALNSQNIGEWTKKQSEFFMAWNKRQYKASTTWLGQKREDWVEWRHQRKLAKYRAEPQLDPGVEVAVSEVMQESTDSLAEGAMAKMVDPEPEPESTESIEEEQTSVVIPQPPVFATNRVEFNPRKPSMDFDWVPSFFRTATKVYFATNAFLFSLALFDYAYDLDLFSWPIIQYALDFVTDRLLAEYSGTLISTKVRATILGTLLLCVSLLMLIGYRPSVTMLLLGFTFVLSILMRMDLSNPISDGKSILVDFFWCFYMLVYASIIFFARDPDYDSVIGDIPQELISDSDKGQIGDNMDMTMPIKPKRPHRRARPLLFYEGFFLLIATILWPFSLFCLAALASADLRADYGLPGDFSSGALSGQIFLGLLFFLAVASTFIVYKYDREARDDPMYAKEKAHYVEAMEHWININKDYYERAHARLTADLPKNNSSEE
tara:strand:- start:25 stop:1605 length:1581 start_codon:yes stop_codon:yes gene_type:complete